MTPINDRQLSRQEIRQKISVIKTNSFDWELLTFDDIKKISSFWHFNSRLVLKTKLSVCKGWFVFVMITIKKYQFCIPIILMRKWVQV